MWVKKYVGMQKTVLQCHNEPTFRNKIISQNQCDTASEIFSSCHVFHLLLTGITAKYFRPELIKKHSLSSIFSLPFLTQKMP